MTAHPLQDRIERSGIKYPRTFFGAFHGSLGKRWHYYRQKLRGHKAITDKDEAWLKDIERVLNTRDSYLRDNDGN